MVRPREVGEETDRHKERQALPRALQGESGNGFHLNTAFGEGDEGRRPSVCASVGEGD